MKNRMNGSCRIYIDVVLVLVCCVLVQGCGGGGSGSSNNVVGGGDGGGEVEYDFEVVEGSWETTDGVHWATGENKNVAELKLDTTIGPNSETAISISLQERNMDNDNRSARLHWVDDVGDGYKLRVNLNRGGMEFSRLNKNLEAPTQSNCRIFMNRKYGGPSRFKLAVGKSYAQVYTGFYGESARYIQGQMPSMSGSIRTIRLVTNHEDIGFSDVSVSKVQNPLPDPFKKNKVGNDMPTIQEFIGSHYDVRSFLSVYRGRGSATSRVESTRNREDGHFVYVSTHEELSHQFLPSLSGPEVVRVDEFDWPQKAPDGLEDQMDSFESKLRNVYSDVDDPSTLPMFWQISNEVNWKHGWKNHPLVAALYAEYHFAPAAQRAQKVSKSLYGDSDSIPIMLASFAKSPSPDTQGFIHQVMNHQIKGIVAPELKGKTVSELVDQLSVHYMFKGRYWRWYMNDVYDRYVGSGTVNALWSTEELGLGGSSHAGPIVAETTFRYLDWWSRHQWKSEKGGLVFWGDWWGEDEFSTAYIVEEMLHDFFGRRELENLTPDTTVTGDPLVRAYAFGDRESADGHIGALVRHNSEGFLTEDKQIQVDQLRLPLSSGQGTESFEVVVQKLTASDIHSQTIDDAHVQNNHLVIPLDHKLDTEFDESLLVFATAEEGGFGKALQHHDLVRESNKLISGGEIISFHLGNFLRSAADGLDAGMKGDEHGLGTHPQNDYSIKYPVTLERSYSTGTEIEVAIRNFSGDGSLYWDGKPLFENFGNGNSTRVFTVPSDLDLSAGEHQLELRADNNRTKIDAVRIKKTGG